MLRYTDVFQVTLIFWIFGIMNCVVISANHSYSSQFLWKTSSAKLLPHVLPTRWLIHEALHGFKNIKFVPGRIMAHMCCGHGLDQIA